MSSAAGALAEIFRLTLAAAVAASPDARRCTERLAGRCLAVETLDARFVLHFEPGLVRIEPDDGPADATLRGSPVALANAMVLAPHGEQADTAAVFGDHTLFEDFRDSFRPHIDLGPADHLKEDLGDAVRLGAKAVESAIEGLANALRGSGRKEP